MVREIRVSPDGNAVAIKSDTEGSSAWGVFHAVHGGSWVPDSVVEGWDVLGS
jgi:hypothetical protein